MDENVIVEQVGQTIDTDGGWIINHWTRTWDTRLPISKLDQEIQGARDAVAQAQANLDKLTATQEDAVQAVALAKPLASPPQVAPAIVN